MNFLFSYLLLVAVNAYTHNTDIWIPSLPFHWCLVTPTTQIIDMITPKIYLSECTSLELPKQCPSSYQLQLLDAPMIIRAKNRRSSTGLPPNEYLHYLIQVLSFETGHQ
jgi:hypothetical protein